MVFARTLGTAELEAPAGVHQALAELQSKTAFMPDYGFKSAEEAVANTGAEEEGASWPAIDTGTSVAGLCEELLTLLMAALIGYFISIFHRKGSSPMA